MKNNMISNNCPLPPLYSLRKDQKESSEQLGPPTRPVCGASTSYRRLAGVMSMILKTVVDNENSICASTEEMMAEIENCK